MALTARQAAVVRASEILGGADRLAERLRISPATLKGMLSGRIGVPQRIFLELVDIIGMEEKPNR